MNCRVCGESCIVSLWPADMPRRMEWFRCLACGSDSTPAAYNKDLYTVEFEDFHRKHAGSNVDEAIEKMSTNLDWFQHHKNGCPDNSFLDIGCCEGASLTGMQQRGWSVHGFEVFTPSYFGPHVTVAPEFKASLFPQRYSAVMTREVIEHVDGWRAFLHECYAVTNRGGLFQVQTPRPWEKDHPNIYSIAHLQLLSPAMMRYWLERIGFEVLDYRLWGDPQAGQAWMCRRSN